MANNNKLDSLARIDHENRLIRLEEAKENVDARFDNKSTELQLEIEKIKLELQTDYNFIKWLSLTLGSITILAIITMVISLYRYINKVAKLKVDEKFDQLFSSEKDRLAQLIQFQSEENQLKRNKKIFVISAPSSKDDFIRKFFNEMKFENVSYIKAEDQAELSGNPDIIFFNSEEVPIPQETMSNYIQKSNPSSLFFYFGFNKFDTTGIQNRIAMANQRTQLYGNLMNTLRFSKLLK